MRLKIGYERHSTYPPNRLWNTLTMLLPMLAMFAPSSREGSSNAPDSSTSARARSSRSSRRCWLLDELQEYDLHRQFKADGHNAV